MELEEMGFEGTYYNHSLCVQCSCEFTSQTEGRFHQEICEHVVLECYDAGRVQ